LSKSLLADIRQSISEQVVDSRTRDLEERLGKRYDYFFTRTGKVKAAAGASPLAGLEGAILEKEGQLKAIKAEYEETESLSSAVKELAQRLETLRTTAKQSESELRELEKKAEGYQSLLGELHKREGEARAAEAEHGRLKAFLDQVLGVCSWSGQAPGEARKSRKMGQGFALKDLARGARRRTDRRDRRPGVAINFQRLGPASGFSYSRPR
jgi:DNA repair exonuclease SbcCD ATPase subunit